MSIDPKSPPEWSLLHPKRRRYTNAASTDVGATFRRVMRKQKEAAEQTAQKVRPLKKAGVK